MGWRESLQHIKDGVRRLAVAAAEMCLGGELGLTLEVAADTSERPCRLLVETDAPADLEEALQGLPYQRLGMVTDEPVLRLGSASWPLEQLWEAWR